MFTNLPTATDSTAAGPVPTTSDPASTADPSAGTTTMPPRAPHRWVRRGAFIAAAALVVGGFVVIADLVTNESTTTTSRFDQHIERLRIDVANGDVEIEGSDEPGVTIEVTTHGGLRTPRHEESVNESVLDIEADCGIGPFTPTCSIDYVVHVPRDTDVWARGSATDYDLVDIGGDVDIALDGGDSDLTFAATPKLVHARSDGGDIRITVPADVAYRVLAGSDGGSTDIDVATDPDSPYVIDAYANGGEVTISRPALESEQSADGVGVEPTRLHGSPNPRRLR